MPMRCLLDINTCIDVMRKHPAVLRWLLAQSADDCAISTVTSYELHTGVEKCAAPQKERAKVDLFLQTVHVLAFDASAAQQSARVRAILEAQGQMIGSYDILLAGHALAAGLVLSMANTTEFRRVPELKLENWQT